MEWEPVETEKRGRSPKLNSCETKLMQSKLKSHEMPKAINNTGSFCWKRAQCLAPPYEFIWDHVSMFSQSALKREETDSLVLGKT